MKLSMSRVIYTQNATAATATRATAAPVVKQIIGGLYAPMISRIAGARSSCGSCGGH